MAAAVVLALVVLGAESALVPGSAGADPSPRPSPVVVAGTSSYTCSVTAAGGIACWGQGVGINSSTPTPMPGFRQVAQLAVSNPALCALGTDGHVRCVGQNSYLGNDLVNVESTSMPTEVDGLTDAVWVSSGPDFTCAVRSTGAVACWGADNYGQLGNGSTTFSRLPVTVSGLTDAVSVAAGEGFACALRQSGAVACWGYNGYGQLGNGTKVNSTTPVAVSGLTGATDLTVANRHACVLDDTGAPTCWGANGNGELYVGNRIDALVPVTVLGGLTGATAIRARSSSTCAVNTAGNVVCWQSTGMATTTSLSSVRSLGGGVSNSVAGALRTTGELRSWGTGYLGDGSFTTTDISQHVAVVGGNMYSEAPTAPGVPSAPNNLTTSFDNGRLVVNWTAPSSTGGSSLTGYAVAAYRGTEPLGIVARTVAGVTTSGQLTTLAPSDTYTMVVMALNKMGSGVGATIEAAAAQGPSVPLDVAVRPGPTSATISWSPPASEGDVPPITGYQAAYTTAFWTAFGPEARSATFDLSPGTYQMRVRALTAAGEGPWSASLDVTVCRCAWGRLVASNGGAGIADARVRALENGSLRGQTYTDADGYYAVPMRTSHTPYVIQFADTTTSPARFALDYHREGGVVTAVTAGTVGMIDSVAVTAGPCACTISGQLSLASDLSPLGDVRVRALEGGVLRAQAYTAADGTYSLKVPSSAVAYKLQFADTIVSPVRFELDYHRVGGVVAPVFGNTTGLTDTVAGPPAVRTITGVVVDSVTGDPVDGLRVRALLGGVSKAQAYSSVDGSFVLSGLTIGTGYAIQVADTRATRSYQVAWYVNSPNPAGATLVTPGNDIVFQAHRLPT